MISPIVFAYNFPHRKTQDIVLRLVALGHVPRLILAAPFVPADVRASPLRVKPRHVDLMDPPELARQLGIEYVVVEHNSDDCLLILDWHDTEIGIVAGARILRRPLIERFTRGIVNLHPGIIPQTRGLDALQWAVLRGQELGVTAHLINERVDAGRILERCVIHEYGDDTLVDLSLRLYETQLTMIDRALRVAMEVPIGELPEVGSGPYNRSFPPELIPEMLRQFALRQQRAA